MIHVELCPDHKPGGGVMACPERHLGRDDNLMRVRSLGFVKGGADEAAVVNYYRFIAVFPDRIPVCFLHPIDAEAEIIHMALIAMAQVVHSQVVLLVALRVTSEPHSCFQEGFEAPSSKFCY